MLASIALAAVASASTVATSRGDQPMRVYAPAATGERTPGKPVVLIVSGEGGWRAFDDQLASWLASAGYWVGGMDCLKYFWKPQDDRGALAADVTRFADALKRVSSSPAETRVVLAGFSFGADLAPWIAGAENRDPRIAALVLIGPDLTGSLEARVIEILGFATTAHTFDTSKALDDVRSIPVLFVHGGKDEGSAAPALAAAFTGRKTLSVVPGATHHFAGHEDELKRAVVDGLRRVLSAMTQEPVDDEATGPAPRAVPRVLPALRAAWPWLLLAVVAVVGWKELREVDFLRVRDLLRVTDTAIVALLIATTAANLALGGFYDVAALGDPALPPPRRSAGASASSRSRGATSSTIGPLAGPALRLWLYGPMGVSAGRARRALLTILAAFTAGLCVWCAAVFVPLPEPLGGPGTRTALAVVAAAALAYGVSQVGRLWRGEAAARRRRTAMTLAAVGIVDWLLAWVVFHLAVASQVQDVAPGASMRIFFVGQLVGLLSLRARRLRLGRPVVGSPAGAADRAPRPHRRGSPPLSRGVLRAAVPLRQPRARGAVRVGRAPHRGRRAHRTCVLRLLLRCGPSRLRRIAVPERPLAHLAGNRPPRPRRDLPRRVDPARVHPHSHLTRVGAGLPVEPSPLRRAVPRRRARRRS